MFYNALAFNQDLSRWCLSNIYSSSSYWSNFSTYSALTTAHLPPLVTQGYSYRCSLSAYQEFVTTRSIPSTDRVLKIPTVSGLTYDFTIDW
jgi:hypothetical protein